MRTQDVEPTDEESQESPDDTMENSKTYSQSVCFSDFPNFYTFSNKRNYIS